MSENRPDRSQTAARERASAEARALFDAAKQANDKESADRLSRMALDLATEWEL
jgi:hypothetical protein